MASTVKIASGRNNSGGLTALDALSSPLFALYDAPEGVLTKWKDNVTQELDGARDYIDIGLPSVTWTFFRLTRAELAYLKSTYEGDVTIYTLDQGGNSYGTFNAKLKPIRANTSMNWSPAGFGDWDEVELTFYDCEAVS